MTREELRELREAEQERKQKYKHTVNVCIASGCVSLRSDKVKEALDKEVAERGLEDEVLVKRVGCVGLCSKGPVALAESTRIVYDGVTPEDAKTIIKNLDKAPSKALRGAMETPFFRRQQKIVLEHSGLIDPERIEDYIAVGATSPCSMH